MAAYLVVQFTEIMDEELFAEFRQRMAASNAGNLLVQADTIEVVAGDIAPLRMAVRTFDNVDQVREWLASAEYAELREIRERAAKTSVIIVEGR